MEAVVSQKTSPQRDVLRARIALMADRGSSTHAIAEVLNVSQQTVTKWRRQAALRGKDGLQEAARSGRPRRISDVARLQLVALACEVAEPEGRSTPTLDEIRTKAMAQGIVTGLSRSHLCDILQQADLRPHKVRMWLHSPDPEFREKVNVICGLYRKAPEGGVVLSIDEKTGMQAIERKHLDRPPRSGRPRRQEFEYVRHGTQALIAALDVHTGRTLAACGDTRTQTDLLTFMDKVAQAYPDQASPLRRNRPLLLLRNRPGSNPERALNAPSQPPLGGGRGPFSVGILSLRTRPGHLDVASDNQHTARGQEVDRSDLVALDLGHGPL